MAADVKKRKKEENGVLEGQETRNTNHTVGNTPRHTVLSITHEEMRENRRKKKVLKSIGTSPGNLLPAPASENNQGVTQPDSKWRLHHSTKHTID